MEFYSTRGQGPVNLDQALVQGIADDGGLFMPTPLPALSVADFDGSASLTSVAETLLAPFFGGSALAAELRQIVEETFSFPIPLTDLPSKTGRARRTLPVGLHAAARRGRGITADDSRGDFR